MSNSSCLLSIIIPFYNNEAFIVTTLNSIFEQVSDDVEVIMINDGSTDLSLTLVKQFLQLHSHARTTLISQRNSGISQARNVGLQHITGRYVIFVDGDDVLSRDYLSTLRPLLLADKYDLIDFNYQKFSSVLPRLPNLSEVNVQPYHIKHEGMANLQPLFKRGVWHLWSRVYRRSLLEGECFENGRRYEDVNFTPFLYFKTEKIAHIDHVLYFYRDNSQGITRNIKEKDIGDMLFAIKKMLNFVGQHPDKGSVRQLAALMIANAFSEVKSMSKVVYGYYYYAPETLKIFYDAAHLCRSSAVPSKKVYQMRYPWIDTYLSKLRWWVRRISIK